MIKNILIMFVIFVAVFNPQVSQAKAANDQDQIILLNDSASALEGSNPGISQSLTKFADEKEKEWEYKNAHKDAPPAIVTDKEISRLQEQVKLLKEAAIAIGTTYPLITQGLKKMAHDINRSIEVEQ